MTTPIIKTVKTTPKVQIQQLRLYIIFKSLLEYPLKSNLKRHAIRKKCTPKSQWFCIKIKLTVAPNVASKQIKSFSKKRKGV